MGKLSIDVLQELASPGRAWGWRKLDRSLASRGIVTGIYLIDALEELRQNGLIAYREDEGHTTLFITKEGKDFLSTTQDQGSLE